MINENTLKSIIDDIFSNHFETFFSNDKITGYTTKSGHNICLPKEIKIEGYTCLFGRGCSKITIIIEEDKEYVYKIPISGEVDGENEVYKYPNNIECEMAIYNDSSEDMKNILLENEFLFNYNSVPIYRQKRVDIIQGNNTLYNPDYIENMTEDDFNEAEKLYSEYFDYTNGIRARVNRNFFYSIVISYNFDCEHIIRELATIDDLHSNNIGYLDDKPVIFDYAGFLLEGDC